MKKKPTCDVHPETTLVCPRCNAAKGGKQRALNTVKAERVKWGKRGGKKAGRGRPLEETT